MNNLSAYSGCGITGVLLNSSELLSDEHEHRFDTMLNSLAHRGPDGSGIYKGSNLLLGHRRLSILDVSNKGTQPMTRDHLTITLNGEIYNFKEIRKTLQTIGYVFQSDTDTEVVLRGYQEWGAEVLHKFNGMFAFAIWNDKLKQLFIARDRLGKKPFYYYHDSYAFVFASEIQTILMSNLLKAEVDINSFEHQLFATSFLETDLTRTLVNKVKSLPPGFQMLVDSGLNLNMSRYWDLPEFSSADFSKDKVQLQDELEELLADSINHRLISDVPVSAFLSGGIDSSLINYFAAHSSEHKLKSITIKYSEGGSDPFSDAEDSDLYYSKEFVKPLFHKIDHEIVTLHTTDITLKNIDDICDLASITDDDRLLSIYKNYECVKNLGFKVVLNGQGADELMAGYIGLKYFYETMFDVQSENEIRIQKMFPARSGVKNILSKYAEVKANNVYSNVYDYYKSFKGEPDFCIHQFLMKSQLARILQFEDYLSMQHSVESRLPFLDYRLVEFAFRIPFNFHYEKGSRNGKVLLRNIASKYLDSSIANRPKQAFPVSRSNKKYNQLLELFHSNHKQILQCDLIRNYLDIDKLKIIGNNLSINEIWLLLAVWRWSEKLKQIIK